MRVSIILIIIQYDLRKLVTILRNKTAILDLGRYLQGFEGRVFQYIPIYYSIAYYAEFCQAIKLIKI